ncbi:DUF6458 family protein [Aeromicrobium sp. CF4.19]|uniref:DUF6458 family protein n=1 Tax=Aeromicrobium sp. CF4.19 TaxID=3373082 RepID=UPI003EE4948F
MSLGVSLFLLAAGAVMSFAIENDTVSWIDLVVVGYILMAVGALGVVLTLVQSAQASSGRRRDY